MLPETAKKQLGESAASRLAKTARNISAGAKVGGWKLKKMYANGTKPLRVMIGAFIDAMDIVYCRGVRFIWRNYGRS